MTKILVVEDEEEIIELVSFILTREGYSVFEASNMTLAMDVIHREIPDLIILDLMLAHHETGFEICRSLKCNNRYKNIPIVIFSAMAFKEHELVCKALDAQDYIIKPFDNDDFINRIKNVLLQEHNKIVSTEGLFLINWLDWYLLTEEEIDNCKTDGYCVYQIAFGNNNFIKYPKGASSVILIGSAPEGALKAKLKEHMRGGGNPLIYEYSCIQKLKLFWRVGVPKEPNITEKDVLNDFFNQYGELPKCNKEFE